MSTLDRVNSSARINTPTNAGVAFHAKRIQAGLSTQIVIQVEGDTPGTLYTMGAVQSLNVSQTRDVSEVYEIGTDAIIQLVPTKATTYTLSIDRMVFDFQRLPQALQREYRHIHAQRRPFNIVVTDYNPYLQNSSAPVGGAVNTPSSGAFPPPPVGQATAYKTTFGNCWFTRLTFAYKANDYLITETCELKCEYIFDSVAPATIEGNIDSLERNTATANDASVMSAFDATTTP